MRRRTGANDGVPFFYFYQVVFKTIGVRLPFSRFEKELLMEINAAPAQLYPNSWAFVKAFDILFGFLGCAPSVDIFLHFFEVKRQWNNLWVTLSNCTDQVIGGDDVDKRKVGSQEVNVVVECKSDVLQRK